MTQLRNCRDALSNDLDRLEAGVGHRGSSFSDIDAISHDGRTHRFLIRELKRASEGLTEGQRRLLCDLALEQRFTVWYVGFWGDGDLAWADMLNFDLSIRQISRAQYRQMLKDWWDNRYQLGRYIDMADEVRQRI